MSLPVLIVEDELNLRETLQEFLCDLGRTCYAAATVKEATELFYQHRPAIVLMDIGLPDGNGLDLARSLRRQAPHLVLLFLSAKNDPETKLEAFEMGGQDYLTKPFSLKELQLRLERILKQQQNLDQQPEVITVGRLSIWFRRFEVADSSGVKISLSQKECALLELLYKKNTEVVSRDEIIDNIWGENSYPSHRTVDNYIVKLRRWAETDPDSLSITSVRGVGYKLEIL